VYPFSYWTQPDASSVGLGAVLPQRYPEDGKVLGYFSYTLNEKERGCGLLPSERVRYAALKAVRRFRHTAFCISLLLYSWHTLRCGD